MVSKKQPVPGYKPTPSGPPVAKKTAGAAPPPRNLPPKQGLQGKGPEWDHLVRMARLGA